MNLQSVIDISQWPLVYYIMPEEVPDEEAEHHIAVLQEVLERQQPFVLIFSGVELPRNSAHFFRLYKEWGKRTREQQRRYCNGAVRVEPDVAKRKSMWRKALRYLTTRSIPYPYTVVSTPEEAEQQARSWLL